jgi:hypothetical protein
MPVSSTVTEPLTTSVPYGVPASAPGAILPRSRIEACTVPVPVNVDTSPSG